MSLNQVKGLLERMTREDLWEVLRMLRHDHGVIIHPLELEWRTTAEAILEAIHASPDLTQRGVRGVLAEAIFRTQVVPRQLQGWKSIPFTGEQAYDLLLDDGTGQVRVQVKNQRREAKQVKVDKRLSKMTGHPVYVVETQRTRNGQAQDGSGEIMATRPYRFNEFDILAVCLQPATGDWTDFIYCPTWRLLSRPEQPQLLKVMQPIYMDGTNGWTKSFDHAATDARGL